MIVCCVLRLYAVCQLITDAGCVKSVSNTCQSLLRDLVCMISSQPHHEKIDVPTFLTKKILTFVTKSKRKPLHISYFEHKTNDWVQSKIKFLVGPQEPLLELLRNGNSHDSGMTHTTTTSPSGHLGGWSAPWSAEEMLDGQHQRVDVPAHARTAHKGLLQKRLEENLCWIIPHISLTIQSIRELI